MPVSYADWLASVSQAPPDDGLTHYSPVPVAMNTVHSHRNAWCGHCEAWHNWQPVGTTHWGWVWHLSSICDLLPPPTNCDCSNCVSEMSAARARREECNCQECRRWLIDNGFLSRPGLYYDGVWADVEPDYYEEEEEDYDDGEDTRGAINDYSYKPVPIFYGQGPAYLGVELELESEGNTYASAERIGAFLGNRAYLKRDGSLDSGFELVTHPHSLSAHLDDFPWAKALAMLADNDMVDTDACGMHVHVSRDAFSGPAHVYRWQAFIYANRPLVTEVARRDSRDWARWPTSATRKSEMIPVAKTFKDPYRLSVIHDVYPERYRVINVQPTTTFEIRAFASTLNVDELHAAIQLVDASVQYTKGLKVGMTNKDTAYTRAAFSEYVDSRPNYAALADAI